jgi:DNA-binding transcriptional ArsR family regulator
MSIHPTSWMEVAFASASQVRLLRVLSHAPNVYWTEREAAREAHLAPSTAHEAFQRLYGTGLIESRRAGRSTLLRLREDLDVNQRLVAMFKQEEETLAGLLDAAAHAAPPKAVLYLFGSTARGDETPLSDIDLLVIASDDAVVQDAAAKVRAAVRRFAPVHLNVLALSRAAARGPRYRGLLRQVAKDGRRLSRVGLDEVLR